MSKTEKSPVTWKMSQTEPSPMTQKMSQTEPSPMTHITDPFWSRVRETARREGIPYQWKALNDEIPGAEPSRCMRNFRIAAGKMQGEHAGFVFQDSDIAKWIEGAAYSLRWHPDP